MRGKIPSLLLKELDELSAKGHSWQLVSGTKHNRLIVDGRCVAHLPKQGRVKQEADTRAVLNVRATIRRAIKEC